MVSPLLPLANFGSFFGIDGLILLIVGLLIFGRRLPEVGKNVGRTIVEFKKGLSGAYTSAGEEKTPEEPEQTGLQRRLQNNSRVSVNANVEERPRPAVRKSLPQTEEV